MLLCFLLGAALDVVVAAPRLGRIAAGELFDPDSYMRLVRLDAILAAHAPVHAVMRDGSGAGTVLAWSHLLDSILLLAATPLAGVIGAREALRWAGVALGPVSVGLLCAAIAWAGAPLTERRWRWTAAVAAATAGPIAGYGMPGVVHHHILLALTDVMTLGWAGRGLRDGALAGWSAGVWAAAGLWLSPETMPFTLMAFGALALAWLAVPGMAAPAARALRAAAAALLPLLVAIVAVDPPAGGRAAAQIDRVSIVYVEMAAACAALGAVMWVLDHARARPGVRWVLGGGAGVVLLGVWLAANPLVAAGPAGLLDAAQARAMFGAIAEMQPVVTLHDAMIRLAGGVLGAAVVMVRAWRTRAVPWAYAALCAVAVVGLGAWHQRFATYGAVLGAGTLPLALGWSARRLAARPAAAALDRLALLGLFLLLPHADAWAGVDAAASGGSRCAVRDAVALLAPYAGRVVLADVNDTPELLYRTGVVTVASLFHGNIAAFMRLRAAWRSRGDAGQRAAVRATGAVAVLACPAAAAGQARSILVADLPPDTLLDRLNRNDPPPWLHRVGQDGGGHVLYAVGVR